MTDLQIDLVANLNAQDDEGLGWTTHFEILLGSVAKNLHLIDRTVA